MLISLNVAYSTTELCIGLFTGRIGTYEKIKLFLFSSFSLSFRSNIVVYVLFCFLVLVFCLSFDMCFSGLVSDAFHLTFGCGLLTFSLFTMAASREKPNGIYTYG